MINLMDEHLWVFKQDKTFKQPKIWKPKEWVARGIILPEKQCGSEVIKSE